MKVLALDAALGRACAGIVVADELVTERISSEPRNEAAVLPALAEAVLLASGVASCALDAIAVTVGPGSFTGIRSALALAHGLSLGSGAPIVGMTVGEAIVPAFPTLGRRRLWVATDSKRRRVFLEIAPGGGDAVRAVTMQTLPAPEGPVAVAGDAAGAVAAALAGAGFDVMLTDARRPRSRHMASVAVARLRGGIPPRDAQALYVDPPEARPQTAPALRRSE